MVQKVGAVLAVVFLAHVAAVQSEQDRNGLVGAGAAEAVQPGSAVTMSVQAGDPIVGAQMAGSQTIFSDDFESSFPGSQWQLMYSSAAGTNQTVRWGKSTYRAAGGSASIWCAAGGSSPQPAGGTYLANMGTFAIYGPFSLSDASAATLEFDTWYNTQLGHDYLYSMVSTDGGNYHGGAGLSGNSNGWTHKTVNLASIAGVAPIGAAQVWVAFIFTSDAATQLEGAYVDNVVISKTTAAACAYSLGAASASLSAAAGSGTVGVTITSGSGCSWTAVSNASTWLHVTSGASGTGNGTVGYSVDANSGSARSGGLTIAGQAFTVNQAAGGVSYAYSYWVPVASHNGGKNNSQWRSDLGLLNTGAVAANVQISFYGNGTVVSNTTSVPAKSQSILVDVVNQIPASNSGALQIQSDQPLKITARSYNLVAPSSSCYPNGTQGQDYPAVISGDGLSAPQSAYLGGLSENPSLRCNIGVVNTGTSVATVLVELFNGAGTKLTDYPVTLNPGDWKQETEPFLNKAGQSALDRGYAKVTVQSGSGVFAFASVVDALTNDPTTVAMQQ